MKSDNDKRLDEVMCICSGTTRGMIVSHFNEGLDFDAISRMTGTNTGCGGCEWDIAQMLKDLQENNLEP